MSVAVVYANNYGLMRDPVRYTKWVSARADVPKGWDKGTG